MRFDEYSISVCYGMSEPHINCRIPQEEKNKSQYNKWCTICNKIASGQDEHAHTHNKIRSEVSENAHTAFRIQIIIENYSIHARYVPNYMNAKNENGTVMGVRALTHTRAPQEKKTSKSIRKHATRTGQKNCFICFTPWAFLSFNYLRFDTFLATTLYTSCLLITNMSKMLMWFDVIESNLA